MAETFLEDGKARNNLMPGQRRLIAGRYLIFYFPQPDGTEVVRVLDGRRDLTGTGTQAGTG